VPKIFKRKRNKALTVMFLPILIFVGFIGWCMYSIGSRKPKRSVKSKSTQNDYVTFLPNVLEEPQEIEKK